MASTGCPPRPRPRATVSPSRTPTCAGVTTTAEEVRMINSSTLDKLSALRLHEMAHAWQEQQRIADHALLTFDERFGLLVDAQLLGRGNPPLHRLLRGAKQWLAGFHILSIFIPPLRPILIMNRLPGSSGRLVSQQ